MNYRKDKRRNWFDIQDQKIAWVLISHQCETIWFRNENAGT
jgi:hypothetical protein